MSHSRYAYRVDGAGRVWSSEASAWTPTGELRLDELFTTHSLGSFSGRERDLLRVMVAVLCADRLSPRVPRHEKPLKRAIAWQREISLNVAVEDPERWAAVADQLDRILRFMTDDIWHVSFQLGRAIDDQQMIPLARPRGVSEVALFSGGLDSAAGLLARSGSRGGKFVAVSACGNTIRRFAQRDVLRSLRSLGAEIEWVKLNHQLQRTQRKRSQMESSQRSRGLVFLAMGAVVASRLEHAEFNVYETGVGCINLPLSPAQIGAHTTRAMHPRVLSLFNELVQMVLDHPVRVVTPFFLSTKAELCREVGPGLSRIAACTSSCDEGEGHKRDSMEHCGLCTSCLFRRIALHGAELEEDPTPYRDVCTRQHDSFELIALESHVDELSSCDSFADLIDIDADIRHAKAHLRHLTSEQAERDVLALYQRYSREARCFLNSRRPEIAARPRFHRKEKHRDLFAKAG